MARVTIEDSLDKALNRFALVLLAAERTVQLLNGSQPLTQKTGNREVVTALREIAEGKVGYAYPENLKKLKREYISSEEDSEFTGDEEDFE